MVNPNFPPAEPYVAEPITPHNAEPYVAEPVTPNVADMDYDSYQLETGDDTLDRFDYGFLTTAEKGSAKAVASNQFSAGIRSGAIGMGDIVQGFKTKNELGLDDGSGTAQKPGAAPGMYGVTGQPMTDNDGQVHAGGEDVAEPDDYEQEINDASRYLKRMGIMKPTHKELMDVMNHRNEVYAKKNPQPVLNHSDPAFKDMLLSTVVNALGLGGKFSGDIANLPYQAAQKRDQEKFALDNQKYQQDQQDLALERRNADQKVASAQYIDKEEGDRYDKAVSDYRLSRRDIQASKDRQAILAQKTQNENDDDLRARIKDVITSAEKRFSTKGKYSKEDERADKAAIAQIALDHHQNPDQLWTIAKKYTVGDISLGGRKFTADEAKDRYKRGADIWKGYLTRSDKVGNVTDDDLAELKKNQAWISEEYGNAIESMALPKVGKSWQLVQAESNSTRADKSLGLQEDRFDFEKGKTDFTENKHKPWESNHKALQATVTTAQKAFDVADKEIKDLNALRVKMTKQAKESDPQFDARKEEVSKSIVRASQKRGESRKALDEAKAKVTEHAKEEPKFTMPTNASHPRMPGTLPPADGLYIGLQGDGSDVDVSNLVEIPTAQPVPKTQPKQSRSQRKKAKAAQAPKPPVKKATTIKNGRSFTR